jgi:hypothetical protein
MSGAVYMGWSSVMSHYRVLGKDEGNRSTEHIVLVQKTSA